MDQNYDNKISYP